MIASWSSVLAVSRSAPSSSRAKCRESHAGRSARSTSRSSERAGAAAATSRARRLVRRSRRCLRGREEARGEGTRLTVGEQASLALGRGRALRSRSPPRAEHASFEGDGAGIRAVANRRRPLPR